MTVCVEGTRTATANRSKKTVRKIRLLSHAAGNLPAIVRIEVDRKTALYAVTETPSEIGGRGFLVREISTNEGETEQYQVLATGLERCCTCKGFQRVGKCKHHDGLAALIEAGKL